MSFVFVFCHCLLSLSLSLSFVISKDAIQCIDYRVMSKVCSACQSWKGKEGADENDRLNDDHNCCVNYEGSAGSKETAGVLECYRESVELNKLRYVKFIGDGDSKSYSEVVKADPYDGVPIKKLECSGHVQKGVGSRLRSLKKVCKEKIIVNGKSIPLLQKLTHKEINKLQNCHGIAIRQSCQTKHLNIMQKAVLYHCSDAHNPEARHQFRPPGETSWCKFQAGNANGTNEYVEKTGLPTYVGDKLLPISRDLGSRDLLSKCTHDTT